jgi:flagellar hook-associated protein FlgK
VSTVSGTESIVNIDIGKGSQRSAELLDGLSISLDLLTISVLGRTFFFDVVTEILQKDDLTTGGGLTGLLNFRTNTVVEEVNGLTQELLNLSGNRLKRVFGDSLTIGTTQVGHQDNGSSTLFKSILDGGKSLNNTVVVGDFTILQGDVEVDTLYTQKEKRIMLVNLHVK